MKVDVTSHPVHFVSSCVWQYVTCGEELIADSVGIKRRLRGKHDMAGVSLVLRCSVCVAWSCVATFTRWSLDRVANSPQLVWTLQTAQEAAAAGACRTTLEGQTAVL